MRGRTECTNRTRPRGYWSRRVQAVCTKRGVVYEGFVRFGRFVQEGVQTGIAR